MKGLLERKSFGFYVVMAAAIAAVISVVRFSVWASSHGTMDSLILIALAAGLVCDIILLVKDWNILSVLATACYSFSLFRLLTSSVGSFVDAFQGINMFGDATQVSTIISISIVMAISAVLSIAASFLRRVKE